MKKTATVLLFTALVASTTHVRAETVQAIVPFPPGGPLDSVARVVTSYLQQSSSDTYVIENRAGANGNIGAKAAAQGASDGRTWLFADGALVTVNPKLYPKDANFDVDKDLKVVAGVALQPAVLVVNANSRWTTLQDFVSHAKTGSLMYASGGNGSTGHLTMEQFASATGLKLTHVPYKGAAPAMTDLLGGQVDAAFVSVAGAIGHVQSGKLRALATSSSQRIAALPNVPTAKEAGVSNFEIEGAYFVMVPAATPPSVATAVADKVMRAVADKGVQDRLLALGLLPRPMSATDAAKWLANERAKASKLIADKQIKAD